MYAALAGGPRSGLVGATVAAPYAFWHYTTFTTAIFPAAVDRSIIATGVVLLTFGLAATAGIVRDRMDALAQAALDASRDHAEELEAANLRLQRANEALEAFTYVVTHDLKEPVRALSVYLDEAQERAVVPEVKENIDRAKDANRRLAALLQGLLEYSRAATGPIVKEPVELARALGTDVWRIQWEQLAHDRGAHVTIAVKDAPAVLATEATIGQIFGNLILNGIRHNKGPAPFVHIYATTSNGAFVDVLVDDNGTGFPAAIISRFDALDGSRPRTVQGGFGLAIVRRAVERLDGEMTLEANPEGGARVRIRLPRA